MFNAGSILMFSPALYICVCIEDAYVKIWYKPDFKDKTGFAELLSKPCFSIFTHPFCRILNSQIHREIMTFNDFGSHQDKLPGSRPNRFFC